MSQDRIARVNRAIQEAIAQMVGSDLADPRITTPAVIVVSAVKTSPDLRQAKVYLTISGEPAVRHGALAALNHARGRLRHALGRRVKLRNTPELVFVADDVETRAARVEEILRQLAAEGETEGA